MVAEADWAGALAGRAEPSHPVQLRMWAGVVGGGGSQPEKAVDFDGRDWWVKPITNSQGPMVPTIEFVVGKLGRLIESPVCDVDIVEITPEVATAQHPAGLAHGSRDVAGAENLRPPLAHRFEDDNRRRHVGVHALFDWCWGSDEQWLYDPADEWRLHSHDHGYYLPPPGPTWTDDDLRAHVGEPHPLNDTTTADLHPDQVDVVADRLEALTRDDLRSVLLEVPLSWGVSDSQLELLGWFLETRASAVAARVRALI